MKKTALFIVGVSILLTSPVMADDRVEQATTYYLYSACMDFVYQDETLTTSAYCKAFIQGAISAHKYLTTFHNVPRHFCLPMLNSEKSIVGLFIKFTEENPNFYEKPAISTLYYVLGQAFSCSEIQPSK